MGEIIVLSPVMILCGITRRYGQYLDKQQQNHQKHIYINVLLNTDSARGEYSGNGFVGVLVCGVIPPLPPTTVHSGNIQLGFVVIRMNFT